VVVVVLDDVVVVSRLLLVTATPENDQVASGSMARQPRESCCLMIMLLTGDFDRGCEYRGIFDRSVVVVVAVVFGPSRDDNQLLMIPADASPLS
jgi:hypothetical protein